METAGFFFVPFHRIARPASRAGVDDLFLFCASVTTAKDGLGGESGGVCGERPPFGILNTKLGFAGVFTRHGMICTSSMQPSWW